MKKLILFMILLAGVYAESGAQQVPRQIIVEHFTNTYCSVCASRNPGFYDNLKNFPQVLHVAYHPSSPYPSCPLNQHNKPENDSRTNFYGVYGGTPRLVLQGEALPANENYNAPSLFTSHFGETSSFELKVKLESSGNSLALTVMIKKADTSSLTALALYSVLVEDTLSFVANNGETLHQDVFRKSFSGPDPMIINMPLSVGDSLTYTQTIPVNAGWNLAECYALAMLSTPDKKIVQAARSARSAGVTGIREPQGEKAFSVYPVPARQYLFIKGNFGKGITAAIMDLSGRKLHHKVLLGEQESLNTGTLPAGTYLLRLQTDKEFQVIKFIHE